ncbi:hypothetical protein GCM10023170_033880 [Phytohabitans houttuyneae]|uniref:Uncharacterized protein n=1 Tax=Phytohabitans houttuyneae TaxID=1076126 RepID=A0A6V8K0S1_9ACTN|nr:hypothetical protein Phou_000180 [Phytohabitans houttuyneae]
MGKVDASRDGAAQWTDLKVSRRFRGQGEVRPLVVRTVAGRRGAQREAIPTPKVELRQGRPRRVRPREQRSGPRRTSRQLTSCFGLDIYQTAKGLYSTGHSWTGVFSCISGM